MMIHIQLATQRLTFIQQQQTLLSTPVSTALNGPGEQAGSGCTPCGKLVVKAKIGTGAPLGSVFVGRRATGEIYTAALGKAQPQRDWILTRILWLGGLEPGKNRYGKVDTLRRYIYIHGCPPEYPMGQALSHGCIRMRDEALVQLFDLVDTGTVVWITD